MDVSSVSSMLEPVFFACHTLDALFGCSVYLSVHVEYNGSIHNLENFEIYEVDGLQGIEDQETYSGYGIVLKRIDDNWLGYCTEFLPFFKGELVKGTSGILFCLPVWDFEFYKNHGSAERALEGMEDGSTLLDAVDQACHVLVRHLATCSKA
jgi:hypothetical protein